MKGWVYIITNRSMPNIVKIGYTHRDPQIRADELNSTGSPRPYEVVYEVLVQDPYKLEQRVHSCLVEYREGKEWFNCSVLKEKKAIRGGVQSEILFEKSYTEQAEITDQTIAPAEMRVPCSIRFCSSEGKFPYGKSILCIDHASKFERAKRTKFKNLQTLNIGFLKKRGLAESSKYHQTRILEDITNDAIKEHLITQWKRKRQRDDH